MSIPERIGKYEVLEAIGRGGFATVYRARDPLMKRVVAIKICTDRDEDLRRRFMREAEIAGSLDHPNIVRGFDCGFDEAGVYLVEEYLDGEDLSSKIRSRSPMSYRRRLAILIDVAQAISYAHSKGVYHRDLKPGNIRVLDNGQVKLMDFGIAKMSTSQTPLTKAGTLLGTAGYVAPEQVLGKPVDHRVDIFAFGALAHELFTYRRPFTGETVKERLHSVLEIDPGPIRAFWPDCPSGLERAVAGCLQKDPAARYSTFGEVIAELSRVQAELKAAEEAPTAMFPHEPPPISPGEDAADATPKTGFKSAAAVPPRDSPTLAMAAPTPAPVAPPEPSPDATLIAPLAVPGLPSVTARSAPLAGPVPSAAPATAAMPASPATAGRSAAPSPPTPSPPAPTPPATTPAPTPRAPTPPAAVASPPRADPTVSAPAQSARPASARRWWLIGALVLLVGFGGGLSIWTVMRSSGSAGHVEPEPASVAPVALATAAPQLEVAAAPSGRVVVDAAPWGEVVAVIAGDGKRVAPPPPASTPLVLTLPPGVYEVQVARPGEGQELGSCRVTVAASGLERCRVELGRVTGRQYFKESGWWQ